MSQLREQTKNRQTVHSQWLDFMAWGLDTHKAIQKKMGAEDCILQWSHLYRVLGRGELRDRSEAVLGGQTDQRQRQNLESGASTGVCDHQSPSDAF